MTEQDERTISDVLHDVTDAEAAIITVILREGGSSWAEEESDMPAYGPADWEYLRGSARDYIAAVDLSRRGFNREQIEAVVFDDDVLVGEQS